MICKSEEIPVDWVAPEKVCSQKGSCLKFLTAAWHDSGSSLRFCLSRHGANGESGNLNRPLTVVFKVSHSCFEGQQESVGTHQHSLTCFLSAFKGIIVNVASKISEMYKRTFMMFKMLHILFPTPKWYLISRVKIYCTFLRLFGRQSLHLFTV